MQLAESVVPHLTRIRALVAQATTVAPDSIHGPDHWERVGANGLEIAKHSGADPLVVALFAMIHDCMRVTDGRDPKHGARAAAFIRARAADLAFLSALQMKQLEHACAYHTHELHHANVTIGTCYDADRLELPRVGIRPDPRKLNTEYGKLLAGR
jgi:uncharacterized protein